MFLGVIAAVCILAALGLFGLYYKRKKEEKEKRGFVVIAGSLLFIYFFPGVALFVIGLVCLLTLL